MSNADMNELGYSLKLAQLSVKNAMEERLRPLALTLSQYAVLLQLSSKGEQTNAALARKAFITAQSMQGILSNLEISGLIERKPDQEHGRRQPATITVEGKLMLKQARKVTRDVETKLLEAVAPLSLVDALSLFRRVHHNLSNFS